MKRPPSSKRWGVGRFRERRPELDSRRRVRSVEPPTVACASTAVGDRESRSSSRRCNDGACTSRARDAVVRVEIEPGQGCRINRDASTMSRARDAVVRVESEPGQAAEFIETPRRRCGLATPSCASQAIQGQGAEFIETPRRRCVHILESRRRRARRKRAGARLPNSSRRLDDGAARDAVVRVEGEPGQGCRIHRGASTTSRVATPSCASKASRGQAAEFIETPRRRCGSRRRRALRDRAAARLPNSSRCLDDGADSRRRRAHRRRAGAAEFIEAPRRRCGSRRRRARRRRAVERLPKSARAQPGQALTLRGVDQPRVCSRAPRRIGTWRPGQEGCRTVLPTPGEDELSSTGATLEGWLQRYGAVAGQVVAAAASASARSPRVW